MQRSINNVFTIHVATLSYWPLNENVAAEPRLRYSAPIQKNLLPTRFYFSSSFLFFYLFVHFIPLFLDCCCCFNIALPVWQIEYILFAARATMTDIGVWCLYILNIQ